MPRMTYIDAVLRAYKLAEQDPPVNTCVYIKRDGGYSFCTYAEYAQDPEIHAFSVAWKSDSDESANDHWHQTARGWLQRNHD